MSLHLYNTLTKQLEEFQPLDPAHVGVYSCGPTVWDRAHIGNGRMIVAFDILFRVLQNRYGAEAVKYVRNITDIEDKIINAAAKKNVTIAEITENTTAAFHVDMATLNCLPPTVEPRSTAHITQMIALKRETDRQRSRLSGGGACAVRCAQLPRLWRAVGPQPAMSRLPAPRVDIAPYKRDPADFVLWKPSPDNYPGWDSPWGRGRPGWHIECSAMAAEHLGEQSSIFMAAASTLFSRTTKTMVAQSYCAHGVVPARLWMHNGHVMAGGQKNVQVAGQFRDRRGSIEQMAGRGDSRGFAFIALTASRWM